MITELRMKSQVTIPKTIIDKLQLSQGDQLEIVEEEGSIRITPVVVYPKEAVEKFQTEAKELRENIKAGKSVGYKSVDKLFSALNS